jgi:hypothetical protein
MFLRQQLSPSTLYRTAMSFLVIAIVLPWLVHPASAPGADWFDGLRGLLLGCALGFIWLFFRMRRV